jgi:hypothetical protein
MNWLRKTVSVLGASVLCGLVAPGCEENESMLFVIGVLATETTNCVAKPESEATRYFSGVLDIALAGNRGYSAALMVGSQLTQRGSRDQLRTETARLRLEGAVVRLTDSQDNPLAISRSDFTVVGTGIVDPSAGTEPGLGAVSIEAIPGSLSHEVAAALGGDGIVIARMRVFGTTLGGQEIESGEYEFPIHVCSGCLVSYPSANLVPGAAGEPECSGPAAAASATVCRLGQDQVAPCTSCNALEVCRLPCTNCSLRHMGANDDVCMTTARPATCG